MSYTEKAKKAMLKKASEKLASARDNYNSERYDSCISDLYYSAFQTVTALLIIRGEILSKHTQVRAFVNRDLAGSGQIDRLHAKLYSKLMDLRSDADYNSEILVNEKVAGEFLKEVEQFNQIIMKLIEKEV